MFYLVETNQITAPLFDRATVGETTNAQYLRSYCADLLHAAFPHVPACVHTVLHAGLTSHMRTQGASASLCQRPVRA